MKPLVTVVVPNYNHARYLPQRLETVASQTLKDIEVIGLDDASTDGSREVLGEFAPLLQMRLSFNETNSGSPFKQWRKGAAMGCGKYLWIAESDDFSHPEFLERLVQQLERHPRAGLAYCNSLIVDGSGNTMGESKDWNRPLDASRWLHDFVASGRDECRLYLSQQNTIPNASAVVVRRDLFLACDDVPSELRLGGDWVTWLKVLCQSDLIYLADPLNRYRDHGNSVREQFGRVRQFTEECRIFAYISGKYQGDATVHRRVRTAALARWRGLRPQLGSAVPISWYVDVAPYLRRISPALMCYTSGSFVWRRLIGSHALAPLRRLRGRQNRRA